MQYSRKQRRSRHDKAKAAHSGAVATPYKPTPRDREAMAAYFARKDARKPSPRMTVTNKKGVAELAVAHPRPEIGQALLMEALGIGDLDFWDGLVRQLAVVGGQGTLERDLNFMLAMVKGIEPRDQIEAMLAAQMAAVLAD
jgi:hypothetical protein